MRFTKPFQQISVSVSKSRILAVIQPVHRLPSLPLPYHTPFRRASSFTGVFTALDKSDCLSRYPSFSTAGGILRGLDWIGTVSFAQSGAVLAASSGMDILGTVVVSTITAVGGGTIRDAIFLSKRPFWVEEVEYLLLCFITGTATFCLWPGLREIVLEDHAVLFTGDTIGIGAFCVIGAQNGIRAGVRPLVSLICGIATATFGGAVRDVLCKRDVRILHSHAEIYATTAAGGALAYISAQRMGMPLIAKAAVGVGVAVGLRYQAWMDGIRLPTWKNEERVTPVPPSSAA